MKNKKNNVFMIIKDYFEKYLMLECKRSQNTFNSYQDAIHMFYDFCVDKLKLKTQDIALETFCKENIVNFLSTTAAEKKWSNNTRNQRLAFFRSFLEYVGNLNKDYMYSQYSQKMGI
jgi:site-specific recombinase XerD